MAVGPYNVYQIANNKIHNNTIDLVNDTLGVLLLDTAHTVDLATHAFVNDVVADEVNGTTFPDYARIAVSGNAISLIAGESVFDAANFDFGNTVTIKCPICGRLSKRWPW